MTKCNEDVSTRRAVLRAGLAVVGGVAAVAGSARAQEKIAPAMVQYQPGPKKGDDGKLLKCVDCANWEAPNACKIVSGVIAPEGWCIAFGPKEG